jgi:hypothetical protein
MGNVPFRSAPARIPETLDQFSTDLISLDRFGSKGDIAGDRRYVRYSPESRHRETLLESPLCARSGHPSGLTRCENLKIIPCCAQS